MSKVTVNGVELDFPVFDAEVFRKYDEAKDHISEEANKSMELAKEKGAAASIVIQCEAIHHAFDMIFGEGTAEAVFSGKKDLQDCTSAYLVLLESEEEQANDLNTKTARVQELTSKDADDNTAS